MDTLQIRSLFPALEDKVYGRPLVYLDNAATSQRPLSVVQKWDDLSLHHNSNLHRAVHRLAVDATEEYESTRDVVAEYIGAADRREIVFTSGATQALNLLAFSLGESVLAEGDVIVISEAEHHSNIVPWQMLAERKRLKIKVLPITSRGEFDMEALQAILEEGGVKLMSFAHVSNVLGVVNPVKAVADLCHRYGVIVVVDGAQGIVHCDVDVRALGVDFYVFSGHKVYAAPGTGVLYGRLELLETLPPYMGGGEMIDTVRWSGTTYAAVPQRFEAGTQNMSGIPTLKPALQLAREMKERATEARQRGIVEYMTQALKSDSRIVLYGDPQRLEDKVPVFSFSCKVAHHEDLAQILDKMGIAVRSGQMCAEPLMDRFGVTGMVRASFAPYNTLQEAQYFVASLDKAIGMLV